MARGDLRLVLRMALAQALYLSAASVFFAFSALAGRDIAPEPALATLPLALATVTTALTTAPASLAMGRWGRAAGFRLGGLAGALAGGASAVAVLTGSFVLFCVGNALFGAFQAFAAYYRFAAADAVGEADKGKAVSWVLAGGVAAALLGPQIAIAARDMLPVAFAGAYLAAAGLGLASIVVPTGVRFEAAAPSTGMASPRPLAAIVRQPVFISAVVNMTAAYALMAFVMTASPLAVTAAGHGIDSAAEITRWHLLGMFAPSLATGWLIARFGVIRLLFAGAALLLASAVLALSGRSLPVFLAALLSLGIGWNFLYVAGSTLLTSSYTPAERAKTQALNEALVFGAAAVATLSAGAAHELYGWAFVNWASLPILMLATAFTAWVGLQRRHLLTLP